LYSQKDHIERGCLFEVTYSTLCKACYLFRYLTFFLLLYLLNTLIIFYFTEFCAVLIVLPSLSQILSIKLKESCPSAKYWARRINLEINGKNQNGAIIRTWRPLS